MDVVAVETQTSGPESHAFNLRRSSPEATTGRCLLLHTWTRLGDDFSDWDENIFAAYVGMARPAELEPAAPGLEGRCSVQLILDPICQDSELNVYAGEPGMRPPHAPTAWESGGTRSSENTWRLHGRNPS